MAAPICHIPTAPPDAAGSAPVLPNIPVATDLASALVALNAMRNVLMRITGQYQLPQFKTVSTTVKPSPPSKKPPPNQGRWLERDRSTEKVKVYNPDDKSQFVEVERINRLTMRDRVTGETWEWKR